MLSWACISVILPESGRRHWAFSKILVGFRWGEDPDLRLDDLRNYQSLGDGSSLTVAEVFGLRASSHCPRPTGVVYVSPGS
jgi:hypothetical protein